ncbi:tryptophan halogenase family protein [Shimia sp.]|uniref:tryptophan halogenase family protein n=1 Tax=Shimia sp. TaxID=1954381 RepID=UPI003298EECB
MKVVIVGGGSAGWITAATLASRFEIGAHSGLEVTVIASASIPRIGVGEATIPTVRNMLRRFDLDESEFMHRCDATFKYGIQFEDWAGLETCFLHPFERINTPDTRNITSRWVAAKNRQKFSDYVSAQSHVIRNKLAPRSVEAPDFQGEFPYAYHMDAELFADLLQEKTMQRGVQYVEGEVAEIRRTDGGAIACLELVNGRAIEADFFVDCTGFASILSNDDENESNWVDQSGSLLCDHVVTLRVPEDPETFAPETFTISKALSAGWCWEIGLRNRKGFGYVYSSAFLSAEDAEKELRAQLDLPTLDVDVNHLEFRVGRVKAAWQQNVVAIGLSAGFLEPLESTGLFLADYAARCLCEMFPTHSGAVSSHALSTRYNQLVSEMHDDIFDFITMHYHVAKRRDTQFWKAASSRDRLSDRLKMLLGIWDLRPPSFSDFSLRYSPFTHQNYEYILLGSGWAPDNITIEIDNLDVASSVLKRQANLKTGLPLQIDFLKVPCQSDGALSD